MISSPTENKTLTLVFFPFFYKKVPLLPFSKPLSFLGRYPTWHENSCAAVSYIKFDDTPVYSYRRVKEKKKKWWVMGHPKVDTDHPVKML